MKRLNFLKSFLKFYSVEKIEIINETENWIHGIAIFTNSDPEEKQEFIWYKSEAEAPSVELNILIDRIVTDKLHVGDMILKETDKLVFTEFSNQTKDELINELLEIEVKMIDNGEETDIFFVHF